jgi:hypothetical protein
MGPSRLTEQTAARTDAPTDLRTGTVTAVTARGIEVDVAGGIAPASVLDTANVAVGDTVALLRTQDSWMVIGRPIGTGTPLDNLSPGSGAGFKILDAMITDGTADLATSVGATVTVPKYSLTFYHPPGHQVLIICGFAWYINSNDGWGINQILDLAGNQVGEWVEPTVSAAFGRYGVMWAPILDSLGGAQRTYYMRMARLAGTGTYFLQQGFAKRGFMVALDMGHTSLTPRT